MHDKPAATTSCLIMRIQVVGNDVELIAPSGARYDVIVTTNGGLALMEQRLAPAHAGAVHDGTNETENNGGI